MWATCTEYADCIYDVTLDTKRVFPYNYIRGIVIDADMTTRSKALPLTITFNFGMRGVFDITQTANTLNGFASEWLKNRYPSTDPLSPIDHTTTMGRDILMRLSPDA